jgi:hypothetical protein
MDGKNPLSSAVRAQTASAMRRDKWGVCAFRTLHKHVIGGEDFFLLETCLGLELLLHESLPVSDLFPAEGDLTGTVANIKDQRPIFGLDFTCDAKRATTRGRNGTASFVTTRQSVTDSNR